MKKRNFIAVAACALALSSCSGFLDQKPDRIMTEDQVYGDVNLTKSVLANFYERISLGQHVGDTDGFALLDEAITYDTKDDQEVDRNWWRTYDYTLIRNINQFLKGLKNRLHCLKLKLLWKGERLVYTCMGLFLYLSRLLGGRMPIVGDELYDFSLSQWTLLLFRVPLEYNRICSSYYREVQNLLQKYLPTRLKNGLAQLNRLKNA